MSPDLSLVQHLLAGTEPAALLPSRRSEEAARVERPLELLACCRLGPLDEGLWHITIRDARGVTYGVPCLRSGEGLRRAVPGDGAAEALLRALDDTGDHSRQFPLAAVRWYSEDCAGERPFDVDQTNELVVVGERAVVKWLLHPTEEAQPGPERLAALAGAGFTGTPRPWGLVSVGTDGGAMLIATVVDYVAGTRDGWEWAVDDVRRLALGEIDAGASLRSIPEVGRLVAGMHLALAGRGRDQASRADTDSWRAEAVADLRGSGIGKPDADLVAQEFARIDDCRSPVVIDVHGDLHIGQILRQARTEALYVIDFDGNPMQSPAQRRARQPVARDVAGMLASLDHVARVVLHRTEGLDDEQQGRVIEWIAAAQRSFLAAYVTVLAEKDEDALLDQRLLRPFQLQQECREFIYAARYLPHWRYVPEAALHALLHQQSEPQIE